MGYSKVCVYSNCRINDKHRDYLEGNCYFISFPKPCTQLLDKRYKGSRNKHIAGCSLCTKSDAWTKLCKPNFGHWIENIPDKCHLCSKHFVGESGPSESSPNPLRCETTKRKVKRSQARGMLSNILLQAGPIRTGLSEKYSKCTVKNTVIATVLPGSMYEQVGQVVEDECEKENNPSSSGLPTTWETPIVPCRVSIGTSTDPDLAVDRATQTQQSEDQEPEKTFAVKGTQTNLTALPHLKRLRSLSVKCKKLKTKYQSNTIRKSPIREMEVTLRKDEKKCVFYTGLTFANIIILMNFLGESCNQLNYWKSNAIKTTKITRRRRFTPLQELLLVLIRLRRGFTVRDMGYRFKISISHVSKLTTTWVLFMYAQFSTVRADMFPSKQRTLETLPAVFSRLKNIRVLVDCTEFFVQTPSNFQHQGNVYSAYKTHTTFKFLIGCTPNGAISYVSDLYEGALSDRDLFERCGITDLLEEGDLVLADRGFTVNDIVEAHGASLNIPPFLKGRDQLTVEEELATKRIAKERIYVEHVIGRLKTFRLLKQVLPLNMRGILSQAIFVCACLCNFQPPIVLD